MQPRQPNHGWPKHLHRTLLGLVLLIGLSSALANWDFAAENFARDGAWTYPA